MYSDCFISQDGQNVCHIVAASHSEDAVDVAELLTKTNCPLDAVDVEVSYLAIFLCFRAIYIDF